jgi:SAM-dependent methyltransferase
VTSDARWLATVWPFVRDWLPAPPAVVVEIGCGPLGGFVPMLRAAGYDASGVDPEAPEGPWYHRAEFERYAAPGPAAAVVASASLHHVADVGEVLGLAGAALASGGTLVVVEWARERFDDATARWCFARLPAPSDVRKSDEHKSDEHKSDEHNWLRHRQDEWLASGLPWERYLQGWAAAEGLHTGEDIVAELDARFDRQFLGYGPFFFADLDGVTEADEQAAIDAGEIQANRILYAGRRRD